MFKKQLGKKDCVVLIAIILILSVVINIYSMYKINVYKYKLGQQSSNYIEEIRQRNESNIEILSKSLKDGNIKNEELLKLYKNYDVIAGNVIGLWQRYASYSENTMVLFSKKIVTDKAIENEVHGQIKEYIECTLNNEMRNERTKLVLRSEDKLCFEAMYELAKNIDDYFKDFNSNTLMDATGEVKEKKVIKKHYWIDMLQGIYGVSDKYLDVQWKIEVEQADEITLEN